jgi:hypothetical protein
MAVQQWRFQAETDGITSLSIFFPKWHPESVGNRLSEEPSVRGSGSVILAAKAATLSTAQPFLKWSGTSTKADAFPRFLRSNVSLHAESTVSILRAV